MLLPPPPLLQPAAAECEREREEDVKWCRPAAGEPEVGVAAFAAAVADAAVMVPAGVSLGAPVTLAEVAAGPVLLGDLQQAQIDVNV